MMQPRSSFMYQALPSLFPSTSCSSDSTLEIRKQHRAIEVWNSRGDSIREVTSARYEIGTSNTLTTDTRHLSLIEKSHAGWIVINSDTGA